MKLYIIRHAIALEPGAPGYENDSQRPLTEKGSQKMFSVARGLKALEVRFDLILSSPYVRARETARILLKVLKMEKEQLAGSENLAPCGSPEQLIGEINANYSTLESIAVVGHEPDLSALISRLMAGGTAISINMKKGGVCHLSAESPLHAQRARLEWMMMPRHLAAFGEKD